MRVFNNGTPMQEEMVKKINGMNDVPVSALKEYFPDKKHGYGVVNVLTRLRLKYGDGASFTCEADKEGTTCTIKIPGRSGRNDDKGQA